MDKMHKRIYDETVVYHIQLLVDAYGRELYKREHVTEVDERLRATIKAKVFREMAETLADTWAVNIHWDTLRCSNDSIDPDSNQD